LQAILHGFESLQTCNNVSKGPKVVGQIEMQIKREQNKNHILETSNNNSHLLFEKKFYLKAFFGAKIK
jgi:hypothetical protein